MPAPLLALIFWTVGLLCLALVMAGTFATWPGEGE